MATVNSVDVNGTSYDIEDTEARSGVAALKTENKTTKDNISDTDQIMIRDTTEKKDKLIDYGKLADAILTKITSKQFTLDQGSKTLVQALNELNSNSFSTYATGDSAQVSLPVKGGGATVMIAYALGGHGNNGEDTVMALFRYNYGGTECSIDYIYNRGDIIIENSVSNNKNTIAFKTQNGSSIKYWKIKTFNI